MSIYQENKIFVNKYKQELEKALSSKTIKKWVNVYFIANGLKYHMQVNFVLGVDKDICILEQNKRLWFCCKLKEKERTIDSNGDINQSNLDDLALSTFINSISYDNIADIKKYLAGKGIKTLKHDSRGIWKVEDIDKWDFGWYLRGSDTSVLKDYPGVKDFKKVISDLKSCPLEIYRHPDVQKTIKDLELFPLSYIKNDYVDYLGYPAKSVSSRKSTSLYKEISLNDVLSERFTSRNIKSICEYYVKDYMPFIMWTVIMPKSSLIDEKETFDRNWK